MSHSHSHDQVEHSHSNGYDSLAEANKAYFNKEASNYDGPLKIDFADRMAPRILSLYPFDENSTTLLDYACGTGLVSQRLAASTKSIVGVDISQGMIDQYNLRISNQGIEPQEMQAFCIELKGVDGELNDRKFDVAICTMAYHHFADINEVTRILAHFLVPGGKLIVVDIADQKGALLSEEFKDIVPHHDGISVEAMRAAFEEAGLVEFSMKNVDKGKNLQGGDVVFFLATGVKPH